MNEIITDPNTINQLGASFEQGGEQGRVVVTVAPPANEVVLPGGYINSEGVLVKDAEIRELNGADEEALAKAASPGAALNLALTRGLVKLGGVTPTSTDLDTLISGDRDAILLAIRRITFGDQATFNAYCQTCNREQEVTVDLEKDIPVHELDNPIADRLFSVTVKAGDVELGLPNGITQRKLIDAPDKSMAELVTILLSGCIQSINDEPSMGKSTALSMSIGDRETLVKEISDRTPGPRLVGVVKACEACGSDIKLPLSLANLFRL
jgi:hypothetical protein